MLVCLFVFWWTSRGAAAAQILILQVILSAAVNFTLGMVVCLFVYAFQLPSLLTSYGGSLLSSLLFYAVSVLSAASVVVGFLLCLYGAGATAVYATVALASSRAQRLADAERRARLLRDHADWRLSFRFARERREESIHAAPASTGSATTPTDACPPGLHRRALLGKQIVAAWL
jgi:predicted lipid-binding transport protein (Tim44 family)